MERDGWYSFHLNNEFRNGHTRDWLSENLGKNNWKVNAYGVLWVYGRENAMAVKLRWL